MASTEATAYPRLQSDARTDVAVLGGGIAGLTLAYLLTREGRSVTVLEAGRIVAGVTGYTTAKLSVQHNLIYADLTDRHGAEAARLYAESQVAALRWVVDTVSDQSIDCDLESVDSLVYTVTDQDIDAVEQEVDAARAAGLPASLVRESALPWPIRSGVTIPQQAQFHPRRYLLALAERIVAAGGVIHENTRALDVTTDADDVVVETDHGMVRCADAVVATHYPFLDRGLLFAKLAPYRDVVVAAVVDPADAPDVIAISTGSEPGGTHSVRTAPYADGKRLLMVTGGQYKTGTTSDVQQHYDELAAWTRDRFPRCEIAYQWSTQDTSSVDRLPYIGRLPHAAEHIWVTTGFSAWGMTNGTLSALILADVVQGRSNHYADLYAADRTTPKASAGKFVKENIDVARELIGGMLRPGLAGMDDLLPGEAGVFLRPGGRTAAYRDDNAVLHVVSARCTHLGCTVRWNDAEKTWDCPCHGSRFSYDGAVLHGPAVDPLRPH